MDSKVQETVIRISKPLKILIYVLHMEDARSWII